MTKKKTNPKPGRPKTKDPRVHRVVVVFNTAEMDRLTKLSKAHASVSEYVRERTLA